MHVTRRGVVEIDAPATSFAGESMYTGPQGPVVHVQAVAVAQAARPTNGLAVASLTLGVIGVAFGLIPLLFFVSLPLGLLALIFGGIALAKSGRAGRRGMSISGTLLGVAAVGLAVVGAAFVDRAFRELGDAVGPASDDEYDVTLDRCELGKYGVLEAEGKVTNTGNDTQSYAVKVEFLDASGTRVADGIDFVSRLGPGRAAVWTASGFNDATGAITCKVSVD